MPRLIPVLALCLAAGCDRSPPAPPAQPAVTPAPPAAPDEPVDASYRCEGQRVDLIRDRGFARVAMSDGRVVRLGAIAGSQPPTWSDVGLRMVIDGDYAALEEDDGRTLMCEPIGQ